MAFRIPCRDCGLCLVLSDELFERKVKDHSVTIRCSGCGAGTRVNGKRLALERSFDEDPEAFDRPTLELSNDDVSQGEPIDDSDERKTLELGREERRKKPKKRAQKAARERAPEPARRGNGVTALLVVGGLLLGGWYLMSGKGESKPKPIVAMPLEVAVPVTAVSASAVPSAAVLPPPVAAPAAGDAGASSDARAGTGDEAAVRAELERVAGEAAQCRMRGDPAGTAFVTVKVEPPGRVKYAKVGALPFADTPTAKCIEGKMLGASLPGFRGEELTLTQAVKLF